MVRLMGGEDLAASLVALEVDSGVILNGVGMLRKLKIGVLERFRVREDPDR
jgi:hypothetical protein